MAQSASHLEGQAASEAKPERRDENTTSVRNHLTFVTLAARKVKISWHAASPTAGILRNIGEQRSDDHGKPQLLPCQQTAIMATELTVQSERAYQKQPHIFLNHKATATKSRKVGKGGRRWYKDVGLGFRTPKTAIEGSYIGQ